MSAPIPGRVQRLLAYDGPLAVRVLGVFGCFLASVSFLACLVPLIAFTALVGWQPTHLAILLSAVATAPVVPGIHGLLGAAAALLDHGRDAHVGRVFWRGFLDGCRRLPAVIGIVAAVTVVVSYDLALLPTSDILLLAVPVIAAVLLGLVVAVSLRAGAPTAPRPSLRGAAIAAGRAPHVVLSWVLLAALAVGAVFLPVVGTSAVLFAPGLSALGIQICARALRFDTREAERTA